MRWREIVRLAKEPAADPNVNLLTVHDYCRNNRQALTTCDKAGCFYCHEIFDPKTISQWIHKEQTAMCPKCGIDSVLAGSDVNINKPLLKMMGMYWFDEFAECQPKHQIS